MSGPTTLDEPIDDVVGADASNVEDDESGVFCESDKVLIVENLLKFGANPDTIDLEGQSPLHAAVRGGHKVVVKRLLQAGTNPNLCDKKVVVNA